MATRGRPRKTPAAEGAPEATEKAGPSEVSQVIAAAHKRYGAAVVTKGSDQKQPWRIPSGVFSFDLATCGGIPHGRMTQFHGPKHSGKTTMAEKLIAGAQRSLPDQQVVFIDAEGHRDATWGEKLGVDNDSLIYVKPESGEHAVDLADAFSHAREVSLIVVDSIGALIPYKEVSSSAEDAHVGLQARLISSMMRKLGSAQIQESNRGHFVTVLCINQQRAHIGGWAPAGQEAIKLPGGKALEHYMSLQAKFKNKETISKDERGFETAEFNEHAFRIEKCKMHGGIRTGEYQLMRRANDELGLSEGDVDDATAMLSHAKKIGCYSGGGSSWTLAIPGYEGNFRNGDAAVKFLYENREVYWMLRCHLIAEHAASLNLPQEFIDYLYG